jgi:alpha-glucosidase
LTVDIGPIEGSYPGMLKERAYEVRLPADWPPTSITVNGAAVHQADSTDKGGWRFEGNTLTTIVPVETIGVTDKVAVEIHRTAGLAARRSEIDGFAGAMTRLRGTYDALQKTWPVSGPPDPLIDAMQTGDRLAYHPERIQEEIAHFREALPKAQAAVGAIQQGFSQRMDDYLKSMSKNALQPADMEAQKRSRLDALAQAQKLLADAK